MREVASEIAAASGLSDRTVQRQITRAMTLAESFPATVDAWEAGAITRLHVRVIEDAGVVLPPERRADFDTAAVAIAAETTPPRLRARLTVLAETLQPTTITERHRAGRERRMVRVIPGDDGMSDLIATLPTVLADGIYDRLTQQARALQDAEKQTAAGCGGAGAVTGADAVVRETPARSVDQIRADMLADMLLTSDPTLDPTRPDDGPGTLGKIRVRIQVTVPALTMLNPGHENADPATLVGRGPIDTDTARTRAESTPVPWDRVITHPIAGAVLHVDTYHRTTAIDRYLRARDHHCRWPGCATPAIRCDIDHTHDHVHGGPTATTNLAHLCRRHHTHKHLTRWQVHQHPGGTLRWTSPTGRTYTDTPDPYPPARVHFPADDPKHPPPGSIDPSGSFDTSAKPPPF